MNERPVWVHEKRRGGEVVTAEVQLALPVNVDDDGEIRLYRIVLPFLPPSKNVIDNWPPQWKHAAKKKWEKAIAAECEALAMPKGIRRIGLSAVLVFASKGRRDPQNYAQQLWHWVPDGLQKAGVLLDDREGCIEFGPNLGVRFQYDLRKGVPKKKRERTVVALTMHVPGRVDR